MTKSIRIENADTSAYKVVVETWEKGLDGDRDVKVGEHPLDHPTSMVTLSIWSNRYLVVRESPL